MRDTRTDAQPIIYVGSTASSLPKRLYSHKERATKSNRPQPIHKYVNEEVGWDNVIIELYENYACVDKNELCKREGEIMRKLSGEGVELKNYAIAGRTKKEYNEENKEILAEKRKEYREKNKEKIVEYREKNKEKIAESNQKYRENNKEKVAESKRKYRENNKVKIAEKNKERVRCETCQCEVARSCLTRHTKSKKHKDAAVLLAEQPI